MNNDIIITNHEPQDITITQQDNQLIFVNGGGEVIGITDVKVNGNSVVTNNIAYVIVPTKVSELQNDEHFITTETDPTVPSVVKEITLADINNWNSKQNTLVSGSTIKTINNISLLGSGNLNVGGVNYSAGTGININEDVITNTITSYNDLTDLPTIPDKTSDLINDSDYVSENELADVAFDGSYTSLSNTPTIPDSTSQLINDSNYVDSNQLSTDLATKQDTLVSGTNIKTINGVSVLGAGDIIVTGGSATDVQINGTSITSGGIANIVTESAYNASTNKIATISDLPDINIFKIAKCVKQITVPAGISSQVLFSVPSITGYTFMGIIPFFQGYADQWLITYSIYATDIVAMINSNYGGSLTNNIEVNLLYLKDDYYNNNLSTYNF